MAVATLLAGLFLLVWGLVNEKTIRSRTTSYQEESSNVKPIDLVNKHLREIYDKAELQENATKSLNQLTAPPILPPPDEQVEINLDEISWTIDETKLEELKGQKINDLAQEALEKRPLSQQIQKEVAEDLRKARELSTYKEALSATIVEKARNQGYAIEVDSEYRIKTIKKIKKRDKAPSVFELVESVPSGGQ